MRALLTLSVFFVLITTGTSIVCDICFGNRTVCEGGKSRCPNRRDTCAMRYFEHNLGETTEQNVEKYCEHSSNCEHNSIQLNFGQGRTYRSHLVCCGRKKCPQDSPEFLPEDTKPNGKQCPGCFAWSRTCQTQVVDCMGSELHCFDASTHLRIGGQHIYTVLKGCSSRSFCVLLRSKSDFFMGKFRKGTCSPEVSGVTQFRRSFLHAVSGFLMMKIFS